MLCALAIASLFQPLPPPYPREGAAKVFENDRVVVWDVTWEKGKTTPLHRHRRTALSVTLQPGIVESVLPDGTTRVGELEDIGNVMYGGKGLVHQEEGVSDTPRRAFVMELKEDASPPLAVPEDVSLAWPRDGAKRVLDNELVTVWDYTFGADREVPLHFHDKDAVVVELAPGRTRSLPAHGEPSETEWTGNRARWAPRGRLHREEHVAGAPRAIVIELKR